MAGSSWAQAYQKLMTLTQWRRHRRLRLRAAGAVGGAQAAITPPTANIDVAFRKWRRLSPLLLHDVDALLSELLL